MCVKYYLLLWRSIAAKNSGYVIATVLKLIRRETIKIVYRYTVDRISINNSLMLVFGVSLFNLN